MKIVKRLRINLPKKLLFKYIGIILIGTSIVLAIVAISLALVLKQQQVAFFNDENIDVDSVSIEMRDGVNIKALIYIDKNLKENTTKSIPTLLFLHGINGRKEHKQSMIFQYVKYGYAVVSLEQRGHGESGSPSGFLSKEPYDMIEVIDYMDTNYQYANTSHMGLIGFSYGGGIGAIAQAIEDRIHATVLYHPLASLESLLDRIPIQNLIGSTIAVTDLDDIQDAFEVANESNTENLLLIQGLSDKIIPPKDTNDFYNLVNGTARTDIELKERPGLGHEGNEKDKTSLKYAITWFEHFYHNQTIDITDLDNEINNVNLLIYGFPKSLVSEYLIIASAIILFMGLSSIVVKLKILPFWEQLPIKKDVDLSREGKEKYKKMVLYRTTSYLGAVIMSGLIFTFLNRSFLYGYFIFFPILTSIIMLFIPSELHSNWKEEWKTWLRNDSIPFIYVVSIIVVPLIYFVILYNLNASLTMNFSIPFLNFSSIPYIILGLGSGIADYVYLREIKGRDGMILMVIRPISILIFLGFVPLPPFPILGGIFSHILFMLLTGVILYYIRVLVTFLSKFYKNSSSLYLLVMLPFVIFYMRVFFRII